MPQRLAKGGLGIGRSSVSRRAPPPTVGFATAGDPPGGFVVNPTIPLKPMR